MSQFNSLEMCAGAGGQALGLEMAGFDHSALIELEPRLTRGDVRRLLRTVGASIL